MSRFISLRTKSLIILFKHWDRLPNSLPKTKDEQKGAEQFFIVDKLDLCRVYTHYFETLGTIYKIRSTFMRVTLHDHH